MLLIKLHLLFVLLSGFGFFMRGIGHITGKSWVQRKSVRILPHIIDTGLLITAIALLVTLEISPLTDWVLAKIIALVVYIVLGVFAFRIAKTPARKGFFWLAALAVFAYMFAVAKTHLVLPWLAAVVAN
ncbi:MAG: SirB2 family protein [Thiotrichales bacterium]|jgi:uncharacterized membrane protein SirB2|nr:SirB2 family protein [Thiotrichales bacterium]